MDYQCVLIIMVVKIGNKWKHFTNYNDNILFETTFYPIFNDLFVICDMKTPKYQFSLTNCQFIK